MRPALELVKNYRGYTFKATRRAQRHYFIVLPTRDASVTVLVNGNMKIENVDYVLRAPNRDEVIFLDDHSVCRRDIVMVKVGLE